MLGYDTELYLYGSGGPQAIELLVMYSFGCGIDVNSDDRRALDNAELEAKSSWKNGKNISALNKRYATFSCSCFILG